MGVDGRDVRGPGRCVDGGRVGMEEDGVRGVDKAVDGSERPESATRLACAGFASGPGKEAKSIGSSFVPPGPSSFGGLAFTDTEDDSAPLLRLRASNFDTLGLEVFCLGIDERGRDGPASPCTATYSMLVSCWSAGFPPVPESI